MKKDKGQQVPEDLLRSLNQYGALKWRYDNSRLHVRYVEWLNPRERERVQEAHPEIEFLFPEIIRQYGTISHE